MAHINRSITLHPFSLVAGLAFGVVCLVAMGQTSVSVTPLATPIRVQYVPDPRDYVQVKEGAPYTVPAGKILTITATGTCDFSNVGSAWVKINGNQESMSHPLEWGDHYFTGLMGSSMTATPAGFTVHAGDVVEVSSFATSGSPGRLWGFLSNQ